MDFAFNGGALRRLRKERNLELIQVAAALGLKTPTTVEAWEEGRTEPKATSLLRMARLFGVSVDEFFPQRKERATA